MRRVVKRVMGWGALAVLVAGIALIAFWLYRGTPRPLPESEVIGHWVAEDGERGQGDFYADGTFVLDGLSFNILTGKNAVGVFSARGTWSAGSGSHLIFLSFDDYRDSGVDRSGLPEIGSMITPTLGWGSSRQLYFSDGEEINRFLMSRVSDTPAPREP